MKKILLATYMCSLILICLCQNAYAQYPFYFSSGNFGPPNNWGQAFAYRMGVVANTNIQGDTATAIGNCYFRFFSANSGGTIYEPSGNLDSLIPLDTPFELATNSVINKAYYFQTFNTTDNYIFKTSGSGAPGNSMGAVIRIQGPIQYVTGLTQYPAGDVYPGENVIITATISDTFSVGQGVYLRYSTDNWATSTVIPMTGSGTQYSATFSGSLNVAGFSPNYYVFTSGDSLTIQGQYADLMTVNLYNNNFANFTYTVDCPFTLSNTSFQMLQTDKARYNPSDIVNLTATFQNTIVSGNLIVKYWHLGDSIGQSTYAISNAGSYSWTWQTPSTDYSGYYVQATLQQGGVNVDSTSIAIDVSSQYDHFPRYGFLSQYSPTDAAYRNNVFQRLNRYHLNAIQFYDVNHKHDVPLAGTVASPDTVWSDIANRENYLSTVLGYIGLAHSSNMKAMDYNLLYGAWTATATADGVLPTWGLYYNNNHTNQWGYTLPATWASNLQIENPADTGWQNFLWGNEANLFQAIPYDGWHIDQLGDPGTVYDYNGNNVNVSNAFGPYITAAKSRLNVNLVMNAVTNYGQSGIAAAPVDFLYTEVWDPYVTYNDLVGLVASNNTYSSNKLATVFAAYINLGNSGSAGTFNTPGVLLADAVMFSAGASHIELGDHMLDNPYFPNSNLRMSCGLEQNMIQYYDFLTGYENLLRDSVTASSATLQTSGGTGLATTATLGKIWVQSTQRTNTQIFQLINLVTANTLNWRDSFGTQSAPTAITNIPVSFSIGPRQITQVFVASPDCNNGVPQQVAYTVSSGTLSFTIPYLDYWTMVVVDYAPVVVTLPIAGSPFCAGSPVTVDFAVNSPFEAGNVFTAQLSDSAGSFASPVNIGSVTGTNSGTMIDTIPLNALHGTGYRIRIVASAPSSTGLDNGINLTILPAVVPTIGISPSPGSTVCANQNVAFTATATNAGSLPTYQWKVNGANVGMDQSSYSDNALANGAIVYCILTSNAACAAPPTVISDSVTMTVNSTLVPGLSVSANPSGAICTSTPVAFTAVPTNGGITPSYQWRVNGTPVGTNSPSYSNSSLNNGDVVSCLMTSSSACAIPDTASYYIIMNVSSSVTPTIAIAATPAGAVCAGSNIVFHSITSGGGNSPSYQWLVNGVNNAVTTDSFSTSSLGNGDIVSCILTSSFSCASVSTAMSNPDTARVNPTVTPAITIQANANNVICPFSVDTFTATIANGGSNPIYVWTKNGNTVGTNSSALYLDSVTVFDQVSCTVTSNANCASPISAGLTALFSVYPQPDATITPDSSVSVCQGDSIQLTAAAGNSSYQWSNSSTAQSIYASLAGSYSVTVKDANGCSASSDPVNVNVNALPAVPVITSRNNDSLFSSSALGYQWYLNSTVIPNATNQNILMTQDGNYQVLITNANGCSNISAIYNETDLGVINVRSGIGVKLYPNPNSGSFTLEFSDNTAHTIDMTDALGRIIVSSIAVTGTSTFDLDDITSGIYFLHILDNGNNESIRFSVVK